MPIQMIFCVETKKSADTDTIYINDTINHWYKKDNTVKISKINMNTKSKYKSKDVIREINQKRKAFVLGETKVIYFIDTDQYESNPDHLRELNEIIHYCEENKYDLVWFCHDVEEVFWGHKIVDSQKVQEAESFRRKKEIRNVQVEKISSNNMYKGVSNIMNILDKYLEKK